MTKPLYASLICVLLGACSTAIDRSTQMITIETPGAQDAICHIMVDGILYKTYPPQTLRIQKSEEPLEVDCMAPGNRDQSVTVKPTVNQSVFYNITNGIVPGVLWDHETGAMFRYPETIVVDFAGTTPVPFPMPQHYNSDIPSPEGYDAEHIVPGMPKLPSDRYNKGSVPGRIDRSVSDEAPIPLTPDDQEPAAAAQTPSVTEQLNRTMNPEILGPSDDDK